MRFMTRASPRRSFRFRAQREKNAVGGATGSPRLGAVGLCAILVAALFDPVTAQMGAVQSLVEAELGFAKDAQQRTVTAAFLAALAEDGVLFRPGPVLGATWTRDNPFPEDFLLDWEPELAEVASSGDLGYTTGPYISGRRGQEPAGFGRFVSVWKRTSAGWRLATDIGITHTGPRVRVETVQARVVPAAPAPAAAAAAADRALNAALAQDHVRALRAALAADARVLRNGHLPALGAAAHELATRDPVATVWQRTGGEASAAQDLAFAYGTWQGGEERGTYFRIWRNVNGSWRLAVDLAVPLPPQR